ncbi:hypothetical protein E2C01_006194 [Portunus trituberculatus]|uniref:Uncharacterized protein n=1 Tax=Portunus trituberculatus TaxID=210409 RepID=A0A5B7CVN1_PORTR|nr:hypothetical protein [Portunus trituberculatus]
MTRPEPPTPDHHYTGRTDPLHILLLHSSLRCPHLPASTILPPSCKRRGEDDPTTKSPSAMSGCRHPPLFNKASPIQSAKTLIEDHFNNCVTLTRQEQQCSK